MTARTELNATERALVALQEEMAQMKRDFEAKAEKLLGEKLVALVEAAASAPEEVDLLIRVSKALEMERWCGLAADRAFDRAMTVCLYSYTEAGPLTP